MPHRGKIVRTVLLTIGLLGIAIFYLLVDPAAGGNWMPQCIFLRTTGLQCPGCGAQRMLHALLRGDIAAAWSYNAFLLLFLPLLIFMAWLELRRTRYPRLYARFYSIPLIVAIALAVVGWFIFRNFIA